MSNLSFSINKQTKETTGKGLYPVKIHGYDNKITAAEYNDEFDCLDLTIENDSYKFRERMFNPTKNIPSWSTPEKQLANFLQRIAHILRRFMTKEEAQFNESNFIDMCKKVASLLQVHAIENEKPFAIKFIYDKGFQYPKIPQTGRVIAVEGEEPLSYSKWEKENVLLPEVTSTPSTNTDTVELF